MTADGSGRSMRYVKVLWEDRPDVWFLSDVADYAQPGGKGEPRLFTAAQLVNSLQSRAALRCASKEEALLRHAAAGGGPVWVNDGLGPVGGGRAAGGPWYAKRYAFYEKDF